MNASDDRFSSGARRGWLTVEPEDATKQLGIDFSDANDTWYDSEKGMMMDLNILNPSLDLNGIDYYFRVSIQESTKGTEWEIENSERAAKRAGRDGDYITHNNEYIYSRGVVDLYKSGQEVKHTLLTADTETVQVTANQGVTAEEVDEVIDSVDDLGL